MKKNISVNIFGTLYPIDEDAYELLQKYNANMRSYYSRREGGEEIADDVEHRVAELLTELRSQGVMAITIEHITEIINRIGDPQQMDETNESADNNTSAEDNTRAQFTGDPTDSASGSGTYSQHTGTTPPPPPPYSDGIADKKLFRDPEDRILGGVLSGLSHYFGIKDPLLLRIITVLLGLLSLSTIAILYVIAWILIPEAITPEDRLRMYGKPVNAKSLNEELLRGVHSASNFVSDPRHQDTARGCLSALLKFIVICIAIFVCSILGLILLTIIAAITGLGIASVVSPSAMGIVELDTFSAMIAALPVWLVALCTLSGLLLVGIPLYAIIRAVFGSNKQPLPPSVKTGLLITWLASIAILIGSTIAIMKVGHEKFISIEKEQNTRDGIYLKSDGWSLLNHQGWEVAEMKGVSSWISEWGLRHDGDHDRYIKLEADDNPNDMKYDLRQSRQIKPGKYVIEGYVKADGLGNALYVILPGSGQEVCVDIPAYVDHGNIVETDTTNGENGIELDSRDNGRRKWTHVEKPFEVTQEGTLVYGITNNPAYTLSPWSSREVSISGIAIRKVEE